MNDRRLFPSENGETYHWKVFNTWLQEAKINALRKEEWEEWWECWKAAIDAAKREL